MSENPILFGLSTFVIDIYIWAFLSANTNTKNLEKNKKIQIRVKIIPKNVFENTKRNTFQVLLIYMNFFIYYIVN